MKISLIAAMTLDRVIGDDGAMPWNLPADLARFKSVTMGFPVLMGRKTYHSLLVKPLPGRKNIVVTSDRDLQAEGCSIVHTIDQGIVEALDHKCLFVIGGATVYEQMLGQADEICLTKIHAQISGDTYFPMLDTGQWQEVSHQFRPADENNIYDMEFVCLRRKSK